MLTVGVEEEFLLLEPDGAVAPVANEVMRRADAGDLLVPEYMAYQVETATRVYTSLDRLRGELRRSRSVAADAAERVGARLVSVGAPPWSAGPVGKLTDRGRYRELARRYPEATAGGATCACQVHIGVPDRNLAVEVLGRLRPWLPTLLAATVNSPIGNGQDTRWSSRRYHTQLRWPTFRPPAMWADGSRYDQAVRALIAHGAAMDVASIYLLARLSARYPTIEVRVGDACLDVEDTVFFAGVVRALVGSLIEDTRHGIRRSVPTGQKINAALVTAARRGIPRLRGGPDRPPRPPAFVSRLLEQITPTLVCNGDAELVFAGLDRLLRRGTGADRQRALWAAAATPADFVTSLAEATVADTAAVSA